MRGAVKRSFAETAKKGDGILNVLELSDSIKGATTEQPHRHAHSFPNRLTLNKSPFQPDHHVVHTSSDPLSGVLALRLRLQDWHRPNRTNANLQQVPDVVPS